MTNPKRGPAPKRSFKKKPATDGRRRSAGQAKPDAFKPKPKPAAAKKTAAEPAERPQPRPRRSSSKRQLKTAADTRERLHAFIAHSGVCSRRAAEKLILEGRVEVNGEIVREMGVKVDRDDEVRVDGQPIRQSRQFTVLLNKPTGVVTTLLDPQRRPTIVQFLPDMGVQLKPIGRLDMDTEGLLICTNDGELAHRLAHPRYGVDKEYVAVVQGVATDKALKQLREGVFVEGRKTAPAKIEVIHAEKSTDSTGLRITIHEGRKRQIRLMCEAVGHPVKSLKRVRIGPLLLKGLRSGQCKLLGKKDVDELRRLVGLGPV